MIERQRVRWLPSAPRATSDVGGQMPPLLVTAFPKDRNWIYGVANIEEAGGKALLFRAWVL